MNATDKLQMLTPKTNTTLVTLLTLYFSLAFSFPSCFSTLSATSMLCWFWKASSIHTAVTSGRTQWHTLKGHSCLKCVLILSAAPYNILH